MAISLALVGCSSKTDDDGAFAEQPPPPSSPTVAAPVAAPAKPLPPPQVRMPVRGVMAALAEGKVAAAIASFEPKFKESLGTSAMNPYAVGRAFGLRVTTRSTDVLRKKMFAGPHAISSFGYNGITLGPPLGAGGKVLSREDAAPIDEAAVRAKIEGIFAQLKIDLEGSDVTIKAVKAPVMKQREPAEKEDNKASKKKGKKEAPKEPAERLVGWEVDVRQTIGGLPVLNRRADFSLWPDGSLRTLSIEWDAFEPEKARADLEAAKQLSAEAIAGIIAETVADTVERTLKRARVGLRVRARSLRLGVDVGGNYPHSDGMRPFGYFVDLVDPEPNISNEANSQASSTLQADAATPAPAAEKDTSTASTSAAG